MDDSPVIDIESDKVSSESLSDNWLIWYQFYFNKINLFKDKSDNIIEFIEFYNK